MFVPFIIGHYRVTAQLGKGGMGMVYRARDTVLHRDVAVKLLPPSFADDPERLARFEREAQVLASLNHPNVAAIYGVESGAIVMELVEGSEIGGRLPVQTVIDYARQMAAGLEAAHEQGIVHRDLKPANIMVTPDGVVKLLDFGLAKAPAASAPATPIHASPTTSPTLTVEMTQAGMILGTAGYMSPEQARGKPVDRRTDIWAFGVILFELLSGRRLYGDGETVNDILAAVVLQEPDYARLPSDTPPHVRRLIERCLRKDPKRRLRDIGDARLLLEEGEPAPVTVLKTSSSSWLPWAVTGIAMAMAALATAIAWRNQTSTAPQPGLSRFVLPLPAGTSLPPNGAAPQWVPAPDGHHLALIAADGAAGKTDLWIRPLGATSVHRLERTEGANYPFWSPDSQHVGFFVGNQIKRVAVSGGGVQTICDLPLPSGRDTAGDGAAWGNDGYIIFGNVNKPLMRVSALGGSPVPVTTLAAGEQSHLWPQILPDGRRVLYLARASMSGKHAVYMQEIGAAGRVRLLDSNTRAVWSPPGMLLFTKENTLWVQRLDARTFQTQGEPAAVEDNVAANDFNGRSSLAVSPAGVLVYRHATSPGPRLLTWRDRAGAILRAVGPPTMFRRPALSPDEKKIALLVGAIQLDLGVVDVASGILTRVTQDGRQSYNAGPVWSPDSQQLAMSMDTGGVRELNLATGKITPLANNVDARDWSPDGKTILCSSGSRVSSLHLSPSPTLQPLLESSQLISQLRFSPHGQYVVYVSEENGTPEVYVATFPSFTVKRKVSANGGEYPVWSRKRNELFYRSPAGMLMSVEVRPGDSIVVGTPKPLFRFGTGRLFNDFGVSADGQQFLISEYVQKEETEKAEIMVVLNWRAALP